MWREPTRDDIVATLTSEELDAFSASGDFGEEPLALLLRRTAEFVRGYIRRNAAAGAKMGPDGTLPESAISPAMDYLAADVLKRMAVPLNEDRRRARQDALAFFEKLAAGEVVPEPHGGTTIADRVAGTPASGSPCPARLLD